MELKQLEKISKALGDINRLKILMNMAEGGGSIQCSKIVSTTELAQPSVSHHIKALVEAGLIEPEKDGRCYTYLLNKELLNAFIADLTALAERTADSSEAHI